MRRAIVTALVFGIATIIAACSTPKPSEPRPIVRVSTTEEFLLEAFHNLPQFSLQLTDIGASEKRLMAVQNGSIDITLATADDTYLAFNGLLPSRAQPMDKIRGIALLRSAAVHLLAGPAAKPGRGLRGLRVVLGNPVGANTALGERLIDSMGIDKSEIRGEFLTRNVAVERLLQGQVDAAFLIGQPPQDLVIQALRGGARLLDIDGAEIERLRSYYPLLKKMLIPPGTYPGQDVSVHTVGVDLLLVCRADLDNQLVYDLTRAYFEETPESIRHETDPQRAPAVVVPLHPGAARYYREREVSR